MLSRLQAQVFSKNNRRYSTRERRRIGQLEGYGLAILDVDRAVGEVNTNGVCSEEVTPKNEVKGQTWEDPETVANGRTLGRDLNREGYTCQGPDNSLVGEREGRSTISRPHQRSPTKSHSRPLRDYGVTGTSIPQRCSNNIVSVNKCHTCSRDCNLVPMARV